MALSIFIKHKEMAMTGLIEKIAMVDGVQTRMLIGGADAGRATVLLHGGSPGLSPFGGGLHLWGDMLDRLAASRKLIVPDLPGSGMTPAGDRPITVDRLVAHTTALIREIAGEPVHLVGHDLGGMVALSTAIAAPSQLASLTIVSSAAASPTGDSVENLALLSPPEPLWSRESQAWAFDRLSYSHHHIDEKLLDASVRQEAQLEDKANDLFFSIMKAKSRFFRVGREDGIQVPVQVICAKNDPLVSVDQSLWLFRIIAAKQREAQFHVINRSGSFPFREQPDEFLRILTAFHGGLDQSAA
jgi:2-hydroxy-6-oxonona-2,4-dienedioate hydrolase